MKKSKLILSLLLFIAIFSLMLTGCTTDKTEEEFTYSRDLDDNGLWIDVDALDHVDLPEYKGIKISEDIYSVSDDDVIAQMDSILASFTTENQVKDRKIIDGDTVNIDYVGSVDGVEFEGGSTGGAGTDVTIGVTSYIDDFLEQLIGHTPGESFDIEVTFPEDYGNEDLNGKDAKFAITVNYISESVVPDLTDDFVSENLKEPYGWENVDQMKAAITDDLEKSAIQIYIQDYLLEKSTVNSLPDKLLKFQEESMLLYYKEYVEYYDMEFEDFLTTYLGVETQEELMEANLETNTETANYYLIVQAIAEDAEISVSEDDIETFFKDTMALEDYTEYEETYGLPYLTMTVLHQSVFDYLTENAVKE
ncbi:trigger factor [Alkalibacter mobilis]|uniref:trigger factor n=1 Tax=Alkalibacter mobilis TaxID=2787712 RepID=UPI00189F76B2|nr:trigger factor [Alkalibacter mobilis]MBF7096456.1 trigger factor [Alkalibacter mobilis]